MDHRWWAAGVALALVPLGRGARASEGCHDGYDGGYLALWDITAEQWDADCAAGRAPADILRARQQDFVHACTARFAPSVASGKIHKTSVEAYCAQGGEGRKRLADQLEPPAPAAKRPSTAAAEWRPNVAGMGPLAKAVEAAKQRFGATACLRGLIHGVSFAETCRGDDFREGWHCSVGPLEGFDYFFFAERQEYTQVVGYHDAVLEYHCMPDAPLKGPLIDSSGMFLGGRCLAHVELDLEHAIGLAEKTGLSFKGRSRAVLTNGRGFAELIRSGQHYEECVPMTKRQLRQVEGKDAWLLWAEGKAVALDAAKGTLLFSREIPPKCMIGISEEAVPLSCMR